VRHPSAPARLDDGIDLRSEFVNAVWAVGMGGLGEHAADMTPSGDLARPLMLEHA
jgi:hypothetical protein